VSTHQQRLNTLKVLEDSCTVLYETLKQLSEESTQNDIQIHPNFAGTCDHVSHFPVDNHQADLLQEAGINSIHTLHDAYQSAISHTLKSRTDIRKLLRSMQRSKSMSQSAKSTMLRELRITVALVSLVVSHDRRADSDGRIVIVLNLFGEAWGSL